MAKAIEANMGKYIQLLLEVKLISFSQNLFPKNCLILYYMIVVCEIMNMVIVICVKNVEVVKPFH